MNMIGAYVKRNVLNEIKGHFRETLLIKCSMDYSDV